MTKEEFADWLHNPTTREILQHLQNRIWALEAEIARSAGDNPRNDFFKRGYVMGLEDLLKIEFEEELSQDDDTSSGTEDSSQT